MQHKEFPGEARGDGGRATSRMCEEGAKKDGYPGSSAGYCEVAKQLLEAFGEAVQAVTSLHEQQFHSIVDGDSSAGRFDVLIHEANERKQNAKYAYLNHLHLHGCVTSRDESFDN